MQLSQSFISYLTPYITGDNKKLVYRTGADLIKLFNIFGCNDQATYLTISREKYTIQQIVKIKKMKQFIEYVFKIHNQQPDWITIDEDLSNLNIYLLPNGWNLSQKEGIIRMQESLTNLCLYFQHEISEEVLLYQIDKMEKRLRDEDYDGVITLSLSTVESLLLFIYWDKKKVMYKYDGNIEKLHKVVRDILKTHPGLYSNDALKSICSSFITIINSLSTFRNGVSDAHGKVLIYKVDNRHAALACNTSKVIIRFLYDSYISQKITLSKN
jgi:hypothetical protein